MSDLGEKPEDELKAYEPGLIDKARWTLDDFGREHFGARNLGNDVFERAADVGGLLGTAATMLPGLWATRGTLAAMSPAAMDASIARSIQAYAPGREAVTMPAQAIATKAGRGRIAHEAETDKIFGGMNDEVAAYLKNYQAKTAHPGAGYFSTAKPGMPSNVNSGGSRAVDYDRALYNQSPSRDFSVVGRAMGGVVSGALKSEYGQGGRTDDLPVQVGSGSFVIPADCVSALGQGSSDAGHKVLQRMFPASPAAPQMASGGSVPIIAAVDEHILSPEQVASVGEGDLDLGHSILDRFVLAVRKNHIKTLKGLPPPAK